jgi:hypothetical protein
MCSDFEFITTSLPIVERLAGSQTSTAEVQHQQKPLHIVHISAEFAPVAKVAP